MKVIPTEDGSLKWELADFGSIDNSDNNPNPNPTPDASDINWSENATSFRGKSGEKFSFRCPVNGVIASSVWGTDVYTDDSSICSSAVHAGLINTSEGGIVTIEILAGLESYVPTEQNGITSRSWASWSGSFAFIR